MTATASKQTHTFSPQQDAALMAVSNWLKDKKAPQVFRLFGYAGTGKTYLAKHLAESIEGRVCFAAFTGKAALVMRSKGCRDASTIHSLIYKVDEDGIGDVKFILNHDSDIRDAKLVVIDECSMVDEKLGIDLLSFGKKVLVLGDPAQLPPVKGFGFFTAADPDFMLTEIHRQAAESPIIRLATTVREGGMLVPGHFGSSKVILRGEVDQNEVLAADQILVGLNRTRITYNRRMRELKGIKGAYPVVGDRLVCLKNNREKGLLNGGIWTAKTVETRTIGPKVEHVLSIKSEDVGMSKKLISATVHQAFFDGSDADLSWEEKRDYDQMTYGYALTTHKSQGSQWDNVYLFDESKAFRDDARRWLYTATTRAAEQITIVI